MSGIIKNATALVILMSFLSGCKSYAPFPELTDGVLDADSENVVYDNKTSIVGANEAHQGLKKNVVAKVQPVIEDEKETVSSVTVKESKEKISSVKNSELQETKQSVQKVKDLSEPNPEVEDVSVSEMSFVIPGKTTPSVITDMDLTEMDAEDAKPVTKVIHPVIKTKTIAPVKKEIKKIVPQQQKSVEPSVFYLVETVYFNNGGSQVDSKYYQALKKVVKEAKSHQGKIIVQGFASSRTRNADIMTHKMANLKVSAARAENVGKLLEKYGMPKKKIITEGLSDSRPVYLEVMPEGERMNRRAEIYISY